MPRPASDQTRYQSYDPKAEQAGNHGESFPRSDEPDSEQHNGGSQNRAGSEQNRRVSRLSQLPDGQPQSAEEDSSQNHTHDQRW